MEKTTHIMSKGTRLVANTIQPRERKDAVIWINWPATAGPKAGQALAGQADQAASGAEQAGSAPVTPHAPPPSQPLPKTPTSSAPPPKPKPTKE